MRIPPFEMERMQSTWENVVEYDLSESGVRPLTLRELVEFGFDLDGVMDTPLGYSQSNGTPELKEILCGIYPGASHENVEVTNGTSEANYLLALALLEPGDEVALESPNYMQYWGLPSSLGAKVNRFNLRIEAGWEPDWDEMERAINPSTKLVYISHPNNPTGKVLSPEAVGRIVSRCEEMDAWLVSDEVYQGAEFGGELTPSCWGMSAKVIVTSGLSKAYGIPGIRVGWIIGPADVIGECWAQHDYITIGPNKLSDIMARAAVTSRDRLYERTRASLDANLPIMREWVDGFDGFLDFRNPDAGAIALMRYGAEIPSYELCERIRVNQSTLIVPGVHLGLEGFIRIWMGGEPGFLAEGLARVGAELGKMRR